MWGQTLCILSKQRVIVKIRGISPWPPKGRSSPKSKPGRAYELHSHVHTVLRVGLKYALLLLHVPCKLLILHCRRRYLGKSCERFMLLLLLLWWLPLLLGLLLCRVCCAKLVPCGMLGLAVPLAVLLPLAIVSDHANRAGGRGTVHVGGDPTATRVCVCCLMARTGLVALHPVMPLVNAVREAVCVFLVDADVHGECPAKVWPWLSIASAITVAAAAVNPTYCYCCGGWCCGC